MDNGHYKWSYDPRNDELQVWPVSGVDKAATPQHFSVTGNDGYTFCSQGRLTVKDGDALATIYESRPFKGDAAVIQANAKSRLRTKIAGHTEWRVEA